MKLADEFIMDASKPLSIPRPGALAAPRTQVLADKNVVAIRRAPAASPFAAKPQIPRPTSSPPPAPLKITADDVIEFFWKLQPAERASLLSRMQREELATTTETPFIPEIEPPRQTLISADLELLAAELPTPSAPPPSMPPPLPAAAAKRDTPAPPASVAAVVVAAPPPPVVVAAPPPPVVVAAPPPPVVVVAPPLPVAVVAPVAIAPPAAPPVAIASPSPARASLPEVTDILFDAMHDLSFFETAVEGGSYCLATALRVIPCLAGLVHLLDVDAREFAVVYAQGPRAERLLLSRHPDSDALLARASRERRPVVVNYGAGDAPIDRHAFFGDPWSALVVPVIHGGRVLAAIELIDPLDGAPFGEIAENALRYIAERYGEFIAARGIELKNVIALPSETLRT